MFTATGKSGALSTPTDTYFKYTSTLIHADGPTVITDASTNNFNLTVNGTPRANNNTPFATGWSNYFNGSTDSISSAKSTNLSLGTSDFTLEFWFISSGTQPGAPRLMGNMVSEAWGSNRFTLGTSSGNLFLQVYNYTTTNITISTSKNIIDNNWHHIALVRSSSTHTLYVDGVSQGTYSSSSSIDGGGTIGYTVGAAGNNGSTELVAGYISNFRIVKGTAVYTTSFTPATSPLTAISNTQLLTCQSNRFVDTSTNAFAITVSGSPAVQSFNPFNITNTSSDGSIYFNSSTSDYLSLPTAAGNLGTGDFTIECWWKATTTTQSAQAAIIAKYPSATQNGWGFKISGTGGAGAVQFAYYDSGYQNAVSSFNPNDLAWHHIAVTRVGTALKLYADGNQVLSTTLSSSNINFGSGISAVTTIGQEVIDGTFINGTISNLRIITGTALYTSSTYTVPTSALTAVSNTSLLTLQYKASHNTTTGHQDSSSNQLLVTSTGSPAAGNFSPFSQTGWSAYFNGSTDYLYFGTTALNFLATGGTSGIAATMEAWVYTTAYSSGASDWMYNPILALGGTYMNFGVRNGKVRLYWYDGGYKYVESSSTNDVPLNTWVHICATISTTTIKLYVNGTLNTTSATYTGLASAGAGNAVYVSVEGNAAYKHTGYISNLRVVNDIVYTASFTPGATPLSAITNTKLLVFQDNRFLDKSSNGFTATITGTPSIQSFSPFAPLDVYKTTTNGGSVYFPTSSDWITVANSANLKVANYNFTLECWIYPTNTASQSYYGIAGKRSADASVGYFLFGLNSSYGLILLASSNGSGWDIANSSGSTALKKYTWYHVALVRNGSSIKAYLNGSLEISVTTSATIYDNTAALSIGNWSETQSSYPWIGYISNFRYQISNAQYTTTFTAPTSLVTPTANTVVMIDGTSTALYDMTSRNNLVTVGTSKISTSLYKYGTGSMVFGSGNYINIPSSNLFAFNTGDFTIETWIYLTSVPADTCIIDGRDGTGTAVKPCLFVQQSSSNYIFFVNGSIRIQGGTYSLNTWQHIAVCRSSGNTKLFVSGTQVGSTYSDSNSYLTCSLRIGYFNDGVTTNSFNGYMDDLRITSYARYLTTFTPAAVAFADK